MRLGLVIILLFSLWACGKGEELDSAVVELGATSEEVSLPEQEVARMAFSGSPDQIPAAIEALYFEIRRAGRYFGGPPRLELTTAPAWESSRLEGELIFPLTAEIGTREYLAKAHNHPPVEYGKASGGRYLSLVFHGGLTNLETGHRRFVNLIDKSGTCVFSFEDSLKELDKRFRVRIMSKIGD